MAADDLLDAITAVVTRARGAARSDDVSAELDDVLARLHGPLRLAIAGKVKAGKSTLLNALLGEELAPTDAGECTKVVTWYEHGQSPEVLAHPLEGEPIPLRWYREDGALEIELGDLAAEDVDHLSVRWPSARLRDLTVIDTPGIASISADISARTHRVLSADDGRVPVADAVLYLMRHTHASDVRFLESFHDDELVHGTPMNSVGVLSRADEIGSCRLNAMEVADRIARRYERDRRLRRLCPLIVPVDGLLACAATTLTEAEFGMVATITRGDPREVDQLLLTADRFVGRDYRTIAVTPIEREHLIERLGLFGVRLCVELVGTSMTPDVTELVADLAERSGLERLRWVLRTQFEQRSRVLKARSALALLGEVLDAGGCSDDVALRAEVERITAGTHEFEEVRLLSALRSGTVELKPDRAAELEQLLGGTGHDHASRLGLPPEASAQEVRTAALVALGPWQRLAEHPLSSRAVQLAARTAARTLEGMVASASAGDAAG